MRADTLAELLASHSPSAVQIMKRSLNEIARGSADAIALHSRYLGKLTERGFPGGRGGFRREAQPEVHWALTGTRRATQALRLMEAVSRTISHPET
jgi:hypothetical protein